MLTTKKIILALVAVTLTCLVPTLALAQDSVLSVQGSGAYNVGYFVNANKGFPDAQMHVGNPGSTGGFGSGDPTVIAGGDLCANIYVFNFDQQMEACCSCRITPNGMQGFSLQDPATGLTCQSAHWDVCQPEHREPSRSSPLSAVGTGVPDCLRRSTPEVLVTSAMLDRTTGRKAGWKRGLPMFGR